MTINNRYLRRSGVLDKVPFSSSQLFYLEKAGDFPRHFMLTPRCAVWSEAEVDEWLRQRAARAVKSGLGPVHTARRRRKSGTGPAKTGAAS